MDDKRQRIYCLKDSSLNETDRLMLAQLLIKARYAVKLGKEKKNGKNTYTYFIEYWEE